MLDYQLLSPEEDPGEIYPYRRVWRSIAIELTIFGVITAIVIGLTRFEIIADTYQQTFQLGIALLPIILFLWFSVRAERLVFQPRQNLIPVMVLSAILANGIAAPMIDIVYTPTLWLPSAGFFGRIFGYMATFGVLSVFIQYAVVRYTVWENNVRIRLDAVAYCAATAVGYATVFNVRFVLLDEPILSAAAIQLMVNLLLHMMVAGIVAYFLAELAIGDPLSFWIPFGIFISSFVYGVFMAFRGVAVQSGVDIDATGHRAIGPYFLAIGFAAVLLWSVSFLIESADERMAVREGIERVR